MKEAILPRKIGEGLPNNVVFVQTMNDTGPCVFIGERLYIYKFLLCFYFK